MTRLFNEHWQCPQCGIKHAKETLFKQWLRSNPRIESRDGFTVYDCDFWVHRFKVMNDRSFQLLMLVEVKTHGAEPSVAQKDTLGLVDQALRNRRSNRHSSIARIQIEAAPSKAISAMTKRRINVRMFGVHILTFSHNGPQDSEWIKWDGTSIDLETLEGLIRFDIDPDKLRPVDLRLHHRKPKQKQMF